MEARLHDELKDQLIESSDEFRILANEHAALERKLDEFAARPHLTEDEQMEEVSLKKRKLHLKDQMEGMILENTASR
ncbi:MAG: YdcH family protein [Bryobacterales bacterium]|nr:YdcH family protein [Bryobacterales bacterium]